jgi:hypothetical protein
MLAVLLTFTLTGCATRYVTPGGPVDLASISNPEIRRQFEVKPASPFPARLAVVRVQESGYRNYRNESYGQGRFSVVTVRDQETEKHFSALSEMGLVSGVATMNRLVIPARLNDDQDIRVAAAAVRADMVLLYSLDTRFRVNDHDIGPVGFITLGFTPNQTATVTTTASAMILDVRTGFIYGLAEASAKKSQAANIWSSEDAVDDCRVATERESIENLVPEVKRLWNDILTEHASQSATAS